MKFKRVIMVLLVGTIFCSQVISAKAEELREENDNISQEVLKILEGIESSELEKEDIKEQDEDYIVETEQQMVRIHESNVIDVAIDNNDNTFEYGIEIELQGDSISTEIVDDVIIMDEKEKKLCGDDRNF